MRGGKSRRAFSSRLQHLPVKQGGVGLLDLREVIKGRQASRWTSLFTEQSFARSVVLGCVQQSILDELDGIHFRGPPSLWDQPNERIKAEGFFFYSWRFSTASTPRFPFFGLRGAREAAGDLVKPKLPRHETMLKFSMHQDYRDAFHPYSPVLIDSDLVEPVRKDAGFNSRDPFRQSAKTAVKPYYHWRVRNGQTTLSAEHLVIPPGARVLPSTPGVTRKSHVNGGAKSKI